MKKLIVVFAVAVLALFAATPTFAAGPESPPQQGVLSVDDLSSFVRVQDFTGSSNQIAIKYYDESGAETSGTSATLNAYSGTNIDQTTDIAATSFRGSGVVEASGDSGAVALLYSSAGSSAGSNYRSDVYPTAADFSEAVGENVFLPQVVGNVSDSGTGTTVNDVVAIQNTTDQLATGTATFTPLGGGSSQTVNLSIPAFASQYIDAGSALGSGFNGSAEISMNDNREVMAVVSRTSAGGGKQSLQAFVSVTNAATGTPISFPQVLKNITDSGFSFSTGIACVSLGTSGSITAVYTPTGSGSAISETKSGSVIQFDQRANSSLGSKFFGSARLTVTSGGPYACIVNKVGPSSSNLRNDTTPGVVSGSEEVFFPFFFKGTTVGGQNQSSAIQVQSLNGAFTGELTAQFYSDSGGSPVSISSSGASGKTSAVIDPRSNGSLSNGVYSVRINASGRSLIAIANTTGAGGSGDIQSSYKGINRGSAIAPTALDVDVVVTEPITATEPITVTEPITTTEPVTTTPTVEPTVEPTTEPTVEPTTEPTVEPTTEPTVEPTTEPTVEPTTEPTVEPTTEPTAEPTEEPTVEPTTEPTAEPTEEPAPEPTDEPAPEPTDEPAPEPTEESDASADEGSDSSSEEEAE